MTNTIRIVATVSELEEVPRATFAMFREKSNPCKHEADVKALADTKFAGIGPNILLTLQQKA